MKLLSREPHLLVGNFVNTLLLMLLPLLFSEENGDLSSSLEETLYERGFLSVRFDCLLGIDLAVPVPVALVFLAVDLFGLQGTFFKGAVFAATSVFLFPIIVIQFIISS